MTLIGLTEQSKQSIRASLQHFAQSQSSDTLCLRQKLLCVQTQSEEEIGALNSFLEKQLKSLLITIMSQGHLTKVGELIALLCDLAQKSHTPNNQTSNKTPIIRQSLAILIVQQVLECLGINDLREILPIISQKLCSFKQLDINNQNRMLRIINHLLKRISKTQDFLIRGQLQFTLTKILPICHDSGFHYRVPTAKGIQIVQDQGQQFSQMFQTGTVTYQFYKDFWMLQKYLMDPNQLTLQDTNNKSTTQETAKKPVSVYKTQPLLSLRLKHIQKVLFQVIAYMKQHPCNDSPNTLLNQPIKFLTNTHLLEFQLSDPYFRKIILLQVIVFSFTLIHLKTVTNTVLKNIMLTENDRIIINKIDLMAQQYLQTLEKQNNLNEKDSKDIGNQFGQRCDSSILNMLKSYFSNQLQWVELKDHWKEKKKVFLRTEPMIVEQQKQKQKKPQKQGVVDYNKKIAQVKAKISKQMAIQGNALLQFLTQPTIPHIVTTPTQTSFAYYWSQGKSCLDSFDFQNTQQKEFQTRSEYNMYEWKALRSLYKQCIKELCLGQKNPQLRQYKALAFIQKKQKQLSVQKQSQTLSQPNPQNPLQSSEPKSTKLFVIQEVAESKEASKQRKEIQNHQQKSAPAQINQQPNLEDGSPKKKQKLQ